MTSNESNRKVDPIPDESYDRSTQEQASVERISQDGEEIGGDSSDSDSADEVAKLLLGCVLIVSLPSLPDPY